MSRRRRRAPATAVLLLGAALWAGGSVTVPAASRAAGADPDPWWGRDKALHVSGSAVLAGGGYAVASCWTDRAAWRVVAGFTVALTAGVAKEGFDAAGGGDPSWRDFTWDVVGTVTGVGVAALVDWLWRR